jgi:hypothetical protein
MLKTPTAEEIMGHSNLSASRHPVENSRVRRAILLSLIGLFVFTGACAAWRYWPNSRLTAVKEMQKELFSPAGRQLSPEDRQQKFEKLRSEMNMLTAAERQGLRTDGMKRRTEELNRYFALAKEEKTRYLDDLIEREERRRAERQENGAQPGAGGPGFGRPGPNGAGAVSRFASAGERDKRREDMLDSQPATQRAEWNEFRKELNARRQQHGLPVTGRP